MEVINLKEIIVKMNNKGSLDASVITDNSRTINFSGDMAFSYLNTLFISSIKKVNEEDKDLILSYINEVLVLKDYEKMFESKELVNFFTPLFSKLKSYYNDTYVKKTKTKKVKRVNKHINKKLVASILVATILGTTTASTAVDKTVEKQKVLDVKPKTKTVQVVEKKPIKKTNNDVAVDEEGISISIDYDDKSESEKAINAHKYDKVIAKYSKKYGLDKNLMFGIAVQERGEHGTIKDAGGATGLMQIQNDVWRDAKLQAYNFDTKSWDTLVVDESRLSDLDYNVKISCMIFQTYLNHTDYNIPQAIQSYNMGPYSIDGIVKDYCYDTNKSFDQVRKNPSDLGWISYRDNVPFGDSNYLEHVLSFCGNDCKFKFKKPNDDKMVVLNVTSEANKKTMKV